MKWAFLLAAFICSLTFSSAQTGAAQVQSGAVDPLAPTLNKKSAAEIDAEWQRSVAKYDVPRAKLLEEARKVANDGPFRADWATLVHYEQPQWYKDAKFGIFIHWGVYAVPAAENEWYPRNMYKPGEGAYKDFQARFADKCDGPKDSCGYKDLIPKFKAEKFNADDWARLFEQAGARYVIPVAEHHDGFSMYDSQLSDWTVVKMGPKRDTLGELSLAIKKHGMHFGLSSHRAEHDFFLDGGRAIRSDVNDPQYASLYGPAHEWINYEDGQHLENDWTYVSQPFADDWEARATELIEKYSPEVVYFDWWAGQPNYRRAVTEVTAMYYNWTTARGTVGVIDIKDYDLNWKAGARDFERGQLDHIEEQHWQTDTSISDGSWGYIEHDTFKTPEFIVRQLVDIVSKNGNLLLNVGPRADGTIPDEVQATLREIGGWLHVNGEAIYATKPWKKFGEGPTQVKQGAFHDKETKPYTTEDFRFTEKNGVVYAIGMSCPADGKAVIHSLGKKDAGFAISSVELLGSTAKVDWQQNEDGLAVQLPANAVKSCMYAYAVSVKTM